MARSTQLCAALEERTHIVETAQELILADVFESYNDDGAP